MTDIITFDGVGVTYGYDGSLLKDITWSLSSTGQVLGIVHKTYDFRFRVSSESVNGGQTINFGYDNDDLLTSAGAMTIMRDPATGFVTGTTLGAITESRTYDGFGAERTHTVIANGTTLYSVDYGTRDAFGRIVNKTETIQGTTHVYGYIYDANGRLIDVTTDGNPTSHYEYDANGNRLVGPGLSASPVYNSQDQLLSYGSCTYTYKNDGSLLTKTCPDGNTTYDYDAFGNLRGVTLPNGTAIAYLIDGQNRRLGKKVNGLVVESFLYRNQLQPTMWLNGDGSVRATFVYGLKPNVPEYMVKGSTTYRLQTDQVGSVRLVVDAAGVVAERIDYDEFGNVVTDSAPGFQPFGFAGGLRDVDTALTRFGMRDYDSSLARWTTRDLFRFAAGQAGLYEYVNNDPLNERDPSGGSGEWPDPGGPPGMPWEPPVCSCPQVPPSAPAASCSANMSDAGNHVNPLWFYNQVRNKGPWDYKQQGSQYQDFGNFNYGATGAAFGFPPFILLRAAGWAQRQAGTSFPWWGTPWGHAPYGDDPDDQAQIQKGIDFFNCACGG